MNNKFIKLTITATFLMLSISLFSCTDTSKKVTVSNNTEEEILVEENEVTELINNGTKLLNDKKYDEANAYYNKAIELDKSNKDLYLEIKDIYLDANRLDDAYFITKTAISNNVDAENMKKVSEEISSKFDVININDKVEQNSEYYFPKNVTAVINDQSITLPIKWDYAKVDTSNSGTFEYYGFNEEYGRKIKVTLTVPQVVYDKQIGCIENIYTTNGKTYIDVDLVGFYITKNLSLQEAFKDKKDIPIIESTEELSLLDGYYIKNDYSTITTYELSNDCSFQLLHHDFVETLGLNRDYPGNSSINLIASFDNFKDYIDLRNPMDIGDLVIDDNTILTNRGTLCWIELKNNVVYSIYRQYTP